MKIELAKWEWQFKRWKNHPKIDQLISWKKKFNNQFHFSFCLIILTSKKYITYKWKQIRKFWWSKISTTKSIVYSFFNIGKTKYVIKTIAKLYKFQSYIFFTLLVSEFASLFWYNSCIKCDFISRLLFWDKINLNQKFYLAKRKSK